MGGGRYITAGFGREDRLYVCFYTEQQATYVAKRLQDQDYEAIVHRCNYAVCRGFRLNTRAPFDTISPAIDEALVAYPTPVAESSLTFAGPDATHDSRRTA